LERAGKLQGIKRGGSSQPRARKVGVLAAESQFTTDADRARSQRAQRTWTEGVGAALLVCVGEGQSVTATDELSERVISESVDAVHEEVAAAMMEAQRVAAANPRAAAATLKHPPNVVLDPLSAGKSRAIAPVRDAYTQRWDARRRDAVEGFAQSVDSATRRFEVGREKALSTVTEQASSAARHPQPVRRALAAIAAAETEQLKFAARVARQVRAAGRVVALQQQHDAAQWNLEQLVPNEQLAQGERERDERRAREEHILVQELRQHVRHPTKRVLARPASVDLVVSKPRSRTDISAPSQSAHISALLAPSPAGGVRRFDSSRTTDTATGGSSTPHRALSPRLRRVVSKIKVPAPEDEARLQAKLASEAAKRIATVTASRYPDRNGNAAHAEYVVARRKKVASKVACVAREESRLRG
ncbi:MAG: hypothetical protein Q8J97_13445, partial [Flavobacteriaceae bacterium]|nr:hypothetical protein [Flavobacteriaceae bacterium]